MPTPRRTCRLPYRTSAPHEPKDFSRSFFAIRDANGELSRNLFNIKAGGGWKGRTVEVVTTEYVNGVPEKRVDAFRAYDSYADAFRDYARLLSASPRYREVIAQAQDAAGFAHGLQRAGYATDPNYAQKLMGVIQRVSET